jgi:hypothetical protein
MKRLRGQNCVGQSTIQGTPSQRAALTLAN